MKVMNTGTDKNKEMDKECDFIANGDGKEDGKGRVTKKVSIIGVET